MAAVRSADSARRTSSRRKNGVEFVIATGMPRAPSASSNTWDCPFVRSSTAIECAGVPPAMSSVIRWAMPSASATSSS